MNISIKNRGKNNYEFIDNDTGEIIGFIDYTVSNVSRSSFIHSIYIKPEYRQLGILKSKFDQIICDMKCKGAEKVELYTISDSAKDVWKKLGFKEKFEQEEDGIRKTQMTKDILIKEFDCRCKSKEEIKAAVGKATDNRWKHRIKV